MADIWCIAELMGHLTLAGRITKPGDNGGFWQIDIPDAESFHTEFFGSQSVYRIRIVSEQIARAYVSHHEMIEYNAPIITREEHEAAMDRAREAIENLRGQVDKLKHGLPAGDRLDDPGEYENDDEDLDQEDDL
ncbi:MAG: hypothetical protein A2029_01390 [Chloroflexi bacterium RBG_19FT_COMBO_47_9]|nr:MAG: hypothetical protein A2W25_05070 [candidate division Zixibacteria bacterium RBG_16_53_22]OGO66562.1 MAG: hypothetical protein A2029_01390 [Chloroflexi bacterium RBG_19FT_COMBO_47_9]